MNESRALVQKLLNKGTKPPNFRVAGPKPDSSGVTSIEGACVTCKHFYLQVAWKGTGMCFRYNHFTDEDMTCDSYDDVVG